VGIRPGRNARFRPLPALATSATEPHPRHRDLSHSSFRLSKAISYPSSKISNKKEGETHATLHNISCSIGHAAAVPLRFYLVIVCLGRERSIHGAKKESQLCGALAAAVHAGKCACSPLVPFNSPAFSIVGDQSLSNFPSLSCSFLYLQI
jgi:hypothetical protein